MLYYSIVLNCVCLHVSQDKLGDVVFVELPEVGAELEKEGMYYYLVPLIPITSCPHVIIFPRSNWCSGECKSSS